jgi:hypothetical protein
MGVHSAESERTHLQSGKEVEESSREARDLRRLQWMVQVLVATIRQDASLTVEQAAEMAASTRAAALRMFPGRETAYQVLCRPRIQRAMRDRFHLQ